MTAPVTLGIDLATASARCVALDAGTGMLLASASAPLPAPERRAGRVSRQRADYAAVAFQVIAQVCRALGPGASRTVALSVTGTSGTVVPCAADGSAVGDARLYDDMSSAAALARAGVVGMPSLGRMLSLYNELRPARFGSSVDVVAAALVGGPVPSDTSHALKAGIDLGARTWPSETLAALGLPQSTLPDLVAPGADLGVVSPSSATAVGLPAGVRIVAGMTDGCTAQVSTGAVRPGDSMGVLGTTLVLKGVSDTEIVTGDGALYSHRSPDGQFWPGGASNCGGGVLAAEFAGRDLAALDLAALDRGPSSVVRYPLARDGERFPVADPNLRSLASGEPVDEVDAYRAVLDGVAFVERLAVETLTALGLRPRRHTLAGGATRSAAWNSIRATVLAPVVDRGVVLGGPGGSALGAAILAAHAAHAALGALGAEPGHPLTDTVDRLVTAPAPVPPDPAEAEVLERAYGTFLALLDNRTRPPQMTTADPSAEGRLHHV